MDRQKKSDDGGDLREYASFMAAKKDSLSQADTTASTVVDIVQTAAMLEKIIRSTGIAFDALVVKEIPGTGVPAVYFRWLYDQPTYLADTNQGWSWFGSQDGKSVGGSTGVQADDPAEMLALWVLHRGVYFIVNLMKANSVETILESRPNIGSDLSACLLAIGTMDHDSDERVSLIALSLLDDLNSKLEAWAAGSKRASNPPPAD